MCTSFAHATEPDSYARDLFAPGPEGHEETLTPRIGIYYRPRAEFSPAGPIRFRPGAPNTDYTHRARAYTELWLKGARAKLTFQNIYSASVPLPESNVEALETYIEFGDGPWRLRVGPQQITLGTGRILTGPLWSQRGRTIDALRWVYNDEGWLIDALIGRHNGSGALRDLAGIEIDRSVDGGLVGV
ncbi:MAG: hypothetical protein AAF658_19105, partial [Myxococcota bacterium]